MCSFQNARGSRSARLIVAVYSVVLDGDNVLESTRLEVYNQLLPNGLADPLGMELLEL